MPLEIERLDKTKFERRIEDVEVPELDFLFSSKNDKRVWPVKNLSALEIAQIEQVVGSGRNLSELVSALFEDPSSENVIELKKKIGLHDGTTPEYVRCLEKILKASVIEIDKPKLVVIADNFPAVIYRLVAKINELSGQGSQIKKRNASTKDQT